MEIQEILENLGNLRNFPRVFGRKGFQLFSCFTILNLYDGKNTHTLYHRKDSREKQTTASPPRLVENSGGGKNSLQNENYTKKKKEM